MLTGIFDVGRMEEVTVKLGTEDKEVNYSSDMSTVD
jgi:hypothetical protein